jgi:hypothetical protein
MAQAPIQNIDKKLHPNLADAQDHLIAATNSVSVAQRDNKYDMQGHAEKARQHIMQASQELKYAAESANAYAQSQQEKK